jgi:dTDP-4-dehydrorhamnose reductase
VVTGAGGRLGSALVRAFGDAGWFVLPWTRAEFDLDEPDSVADQLDLLKPELVVHAAAWTDVDSCARQPDLALARNGYASRILAAASHAVSSAFVLISTNEVFSGERTDGRGYGPADSTDPPNSYGRSKLAAEQFALDAYGGYSNLSIVRTAWLFGSGKPDFPARIAAAAANAIATGRHLRLVADEIGTPTFVSDLAGAVVRLSHERRNGVHHVVNTGKASRAEWAREVLRRLQIDVPIEEITLDDHVRASTPPRWGVLAATPLPGGQLRDWRDAMSDRIAVAPHS